MSAVKISALTQVIHFFSLTQLTQGRSLGLCIYSVAERLYDHINPETFQMRALASLQRAIACINSYQSAK